MPSQNWETPNFFVDLDWISLSWVSRTQMHGEPPERNDLIRLTAIIELLLTTAERVDGELVDEALIADLYELRDRAHMTLERPDW